MPKIVPVSQPSELSDPRAPTTTWPPRRIRDIGGRHRRIYPRPPDRGGAVPIMGNPQPVGKTQERGGISRSIFYGGQAPWNKTSRIPRLTQTLSQRIQRDLREEAAKARAGARKELKLRPGLGGLDVAAAPRWRPGLRIPWGRGYLFDLIGRRTRGSTYEKLRVPRQTWSRLFRERDESLTAKTERFKRMIRGRRRVLRPGLGKLDTAEATASEAMQHPQAAAPALRPTTGAADSENGGGDGGGLGDVGPILTLGAVVFVAWLIFRGR